MEWINLSELKKYDMLINLGMVLEIIERAVDCRVKVTTRNDNDIWLTFDKDSMILIQNHK